MHWDPFEIGFVAEDLVFPLVETLTVTGGGIGFDKLSHPQLKNLKLETGGLPAKAVQAVAAADLPQLLKLDLWLGTDDYGGSGNVAMLQPIFCKVLPQLEILGLKNADFQNEIAKGMTTSTILGRIRSLDMSMGTMTDQGAKDILDHADKFKHLTSLDLSENFISDDLCKQLSTAFGDIVDTSDQEEEEDGYLYTSVGE